MGTLFRELDQSQVDIEDLFFMLKQSPTIQEKVDAKEYEYKGGDIKFNDVSFKHPGEINNNGNTTVNEYLFKNLNLTLKEGTTNAIVGPSGFGKTTMLYLMVNSYILINDKCIITFNKNL